MSDPNSAPTRVLVVCLGNICRSPLARLTIQLAAQRANLRLHVDSCGTGPWHIGKPADQRSIDAAARAGLTLQHTARQFSREADLYPPFDYYLAMDAQNRADLLKLGCLPGRVFLLTAFDPAYAADVASAPGVPDPYHDGPAAFDHVLAMLTTAADGFVAHVAHVARQHPRP